MRTISHPVPDSWRPPIEKLCATSWRRLIVIGAPDRGKSSFCDALLQALGTAGKTARLLDTALAEKLVGPPASLSLGRLSGGAYECDALYFVGGLLAHRHMPTILSGVARLAGSAGHGPDTRLVIDTGGSVATLGRKLKRLKVDALQPDHIVAIGEDAELDALLASYQSPMLLRLPAAPDARPRNAMTRALMRLEAFQAVFSDATPQALAGRLVEPWDESEFDWTDGQFICGAGDGEGNDLGLAILHRVEKDSGVIHVVTSVEPGRIRRLRVGMVLPDELQNLL